jgi:ribosomal protein S18 acetylase RimI-like enzyme
VIARVTRDDLDDLLPLMRGYCDFYEVAPSDASLRALSLTLIANPDTSGLQLIARDDGTDDAAGTAVGFATLYWTFSTLAASAIGLMNDLYVDPQARGGGTGRALIEACEAECAARGLPLLEWETAPDNTTAQALYDSLGAQRSEWVAYTLAVRPR